MSVERTIGDLLRLEYVKGKYSDSEERHKAVRERKRKKPKKKKNHHRKAMLPS